MSGRRKLPTDLDRACRRFQKWRSKRVPRERIPDALWRLATRLACKHGVAPVSSALRLDYYSLKRRVNDLQAVESADKPAEFVEVNSSALSMTAGTECRIEFEHPDKGALRISIKGGDPLNVAELGREFWREQ